MSFIRSFGSYVPERIVTNQELAIAVGEDPGWIEQVSGIRERRWAHADETVTSLAVAAAKVCLEQAAINAADLGMLLVASGSSDRFCPGPAAGVAAALGLNSTPALDIPVASAGSLVALDLARRLAPSTGKILIVGAEIMSRRIDLTPSGRNTAILFGDGAGACLVDPERGPLRLVDGALFTDGNAAEILTVTGNRLVMDGGAVILQASRKIPRAILLLLERNGITPAEVAQVLMHQANLNLIERVARAVAIPADRFFVNIGRFGNTSGASMLIAAHEWRQRSDAPSGPVVFAAFGTGLNWGALLAQPA